MCLFLSLPLSNLVFWSHGGQKKRRGQTLFYSNPKPSEQTQIQPNRIYSRVPLQMVICRLSIGSGAGPPVIDTTTTTQLREEVEEEEMLTSCCYFTFCNYFSLFHDHVFPFILGNTWSSTLTSIYRLIFSLICFFSHGNAALCWQCCSVGVPHLSRRHKCLSYRHSWWLEHPSQWLWSALDSSPPSGEEFRHVRQYVAYQSWVTWLNVVILIQSLIYSKTYPSGFGA